MIEGANPVTQAFLGTLFTWAVTAAGSAVVFVCRGNQRKFLDSSLGFAAGVMTAASYWSLLEPSIEYARLSGLYGKNGELSFIPAVVGFIGGAQFLIIADFLLPSTDPVTNLCITKEDGHNREDFCKDDDSYHTPYKKSGLKKRGAQDSNGRSRTFNAHKNKSTTSWKRILLLIIAITIHNIPEGLAVGVGFGSVGKSPSSTFAKSRNLALGIGIQNFPEGLAVSIPLRASGMSTLSSFWYGQLSGAVEPLFGVLGALCVTLAEPLLPYVLAFAAGAMIFVVFDDIIPEAQTCGNGRLASVGAMLGFALMMSLDVGLS